MTQPPSAPPGSALPASVTVLVVDDSKAMRTIVMRTIRQAGFEQLDFEEAENGAEAKDILDQTPGIQLLLSDIVMPGEEDGISLGLWTRERFPHMHVALMSGYSRDQTPAAIKFPYLQKPYRREALLEIVERATSAAKPVAPQARAG